MINQTYIEMNNIRSEGAMNTETWKLYCRLNANKEMHNKIDRIVQKATEIDDVEEGIEKYISDLRGMIRDGLVTDEYARMMFRDIPRMWRVDWRKIAIVWCRD